METMFRMNSAVADDTIEMLNEDNPRVKYRFRKCGTTRGLIIALVVLLVIGIIVGVIILRFTSKGTKKAQIENPSAGLCKRCMLVYLTSCYFHKYLDNTKGRTRN